MYYLSKLVDTYTVHHFRHCATYILHSTHLDLVASAELFDDACWDSRSWQVALVSLDRLRLLDVFKSPLILSVSPCPTAILRATFSSKRQLGVLQVGQ